MPWYEVRINERPSAEGFVNAISKAIQSSDSARNVVESQLYMKDNGENEWIFYISPSLANLLHHEVPGFTLTICAEPDRAGVQLVLPAG